VQAQADKIFSRWNGSTPGCAVAASVNGQAVVRSAYGMADLERNVPNTPDTIFDAGSVAKQFTAAAVVLLARDGRLSLERPRVGQRHASRPSSSSRYDDCTDARVRGWVLELPGLLRRLRA
jgi:hypothetical protein